MDDFSVIPAPVPPTPEPAPQDPNAKDIEDMSAIVKRFGGSLGYTAQKGIVSYG